MPDSPDSTAIIRNLWNEDLRSWLQTYVQSHRHHPTSVLSRAQYIGVSRPALDAYLEGTYFLPKEMGGQGGDPASSTVEQSIRAYRDRIEGTIRHGYVNTFVETHTWRQVQQACTVALNENVIVIVYGRAGVGKSRGLLEYAVRQMTTAPISVLCSPNITTRYFIQKLAQGLGLPDKTVTARLEDIVAERLRHYPRPLFIDQANYLNANALGTICYIWEIARVPIVLAGTKALYNLFFSSGLTDEVRTQLSSRVAMHYLLSELTLAEAKGIIQRVLGEEATDDVVAQIFNVTAGVHRHIDMILPRIIDLKVRNKAKLASGKLTLRDIITVAGSRLIMGVPQNV